MRITPSSKYIKANYKIEDWGNDYLVILERQWSRCELDLNYDSIYY